MKKIICFVVGHKWNEVALQNGYADCERCGTGQPCGRREPFTLRSWLWWRRYYLGRLFRNLRSRIEDWHRPKDDNDVPF